MCSPTGSRRLRRKADAHSSPGRNQAAVRPTQYEWQSLHAVPLWRSKRRRTMTYEVFRNENGRYYIASVDNKGFHEVPEVWTSMNQFASREQAECQARKRNPYNKASGKLRISHEGDKWYWAFPPREGDVESGEVVCLATPAPKRFDLEVWQLAHFPFASPVEIVRWSLSGSGLKDGENARLSAMSQWGIISFLLRKSTEASMNLY